MGSILSKSAAFQYALARLNRPPRRYGFCALPASMSLTAIGIWLAVKACVPASKSWASLYLVGFATMSDHMDASDAVSPDALSAAVNPACAGCAFGPFG